MLTPPGDVTRLLQRVSAGDRRAVQELLPLVYDELRLLAAARMTRERADHTLQPTALVHEAWLRLVNCGQPQWKDRRHFFRAAAAVMRHVLVDRARQRQRQKRGGGCQAVPLGPEFIAFEERAHDLLALDEALSKLERIAPRQTDLIELRFFAGLTMQQAAETLGISPRTAYTEWRLARAWLLHELESA
jgi:RNA polymerase sigma-70 factor (ECF subfamily)